MACISTYVKIKLEIRKIKTIKIKLFWFYYTYEENYTFYER